MDTDCLHCQGGNLSWRRLNSPINARDLAVIKNGRIDFQERVKREGFGSGWRFWSWIEEIVVLNGKAFVVHLEGPHKDRIVTDLNSQTCAYNLAKVAR